MVKFAHQKQKCINIELIIFDFDGTLGDTRRNIVLTMQSTMRQLGLDIADEETCTATIGIPLKAAFARIFPHLSDEALENCTETYRKLFDVNKKSLIPSPFPQVKETLDRLKRQGIPMTIASSRSSVSLRELIDEMGLTDYISYILGAEDVVRAKPDPEPVLKTIDHFGKKAENTLVVGDMPVDIMMGVRSKAHTCGVTYGNASEAQLKEAGADFIIHNLSELLKILHIE